MGELIELFSGKSEQGDLPDLPLAPEAINDFLGYVEELVDAADEGWEVFAEKMALIRACVEEWPE